jgi:pyruvate,orthophosphate dikinase
MTNIGLPVPPGFIITTEACKDFTRLGQKFPEGLEDQIREKVMILEKNAWAKASVTKPSPCWFPCVPGRPFPCPA